MVCDFSKLFSTPSLLLMSQLKLCQLEESVPGGLLQQSRPMTASLRHGHAQASLTFPTERRPAKALHRH